MPSVDFLDEEIGVVVSASDKYFGGGATLMRFGYIPML